MSRKSVFVAGISIDRSLCLEAPHSGVTGSTSGEGGAVHGTSATCIASMVSHQTRILPVLFRLAPSHARKT